MTHALIDDLQRLADPDKAEPMQAYMKTDQPFYGVQAKPRRDSFKAIAKQFKAISRPEYEQIIFELWQSSHREAMYQALEVAQHFKKYRDPGSWPIYERLVRTASHWDTLDEVARNLISALVRQHREFEARLVEWAEDDNFWVRRASLLAHLKHKAQTNTVLLAETILKLAPEKEFFIRKAIGWVLRDYSYTNPAWVRQFVEQHAAQLSSLSQQEALKQINRPQSQARREEL
jgi:3-methyladenine DNA glycosylase AlkD